MTLTGLAAMPAKIILTGVCFYLVPLYIVSIGNTRAMAGRLLMIYAVVMVLLVPLAAGLSSATDRRERLVALAACASPGWAVSSSSWSAASMPSSSRC